VEAAYDGIHTVLKVDKLKPDLLILDLCLPDVEGFRVMERLSTTTRSRAARIFMPTTCTRATTPGTT
jgi:DNA-binding response OmpR family regulator